MESQSLPSDHIPVLFTDKDGISHEGIFNALLQAFVEKVGDEGPEDSGISYLPEEISSWEYLEDQHNPDSDTMNIL